MNKCIGEVRRTILGTFGKSVEYQVSDCVQTPSLSTILELVMDFLNAFFNILFEVLNSQVELVSFILGLGEGGIP